MLDNVAILDARELIFSRDTINGITPIVGELSLPIVNWNSLIVECIIRERNFIICIVLGLVLTCEDFEPKVDRSVSKLWIATNIFAIQKNRIRDIDLALLL